MYIKVCILELFETHWHWYLSVCICRPYTFGLIFSSIQVQFLSAIRLSSVNFSSVDFYSVQLISVQKEQDHSSSILY